MITRSDFFLELPRNFAFLKNLPLTFKTLVLKAGTQTESGQWYLVRISGQEMNLKSAIQLKPGETLLLQKSGDMQLKVLERISPESFPETKESAQSGTLKDTPNATETNGPIFLPETLFDVLQLFALRVLNDKNENFLQQEARCYFFDVRWPETIRGLFMKRQPAEYDLYLSEESLSEYSYEKSELLNLFTDLPIHSISLVSENALKLLRSGGISITG